MDAAAVATGTAGAGGSVADGGAAAAADSALLPRLDP